MKFLHDIQPIQTRPERILQFGTGVFLRGFFAPLVQKANDECAFDGNIIVVGSTEKSGVGALNAQNGLFTVYECGIQDGTTIEHAEIIDSISLGLAAASDWDRVLHTAMNPDMGFVVSNTTEIGIVFDENDDLSANPPHSFPAKLTTWLWTRALWCDFNPEFAPLILPCELIENNGDALRLIVYKWADRVENPTKFKAWLDHIIFVNTLVDRIVIGVPDEVRHREIEAELGYADQLLTVCEPYRLFAIQGNENIQKRLSFLQASPDVIIAEDIEAFRLQKLHILNGTHSICTFKALALGIETVIEAMNHVEMRIFIENVTLNEIARTLQTKAAYSFAETTLERFRNPYLAHRWANITLHATKKMAVRVVPTIQRYVTQNGTLPSLLIEGFAAFLHGRREINDTLPFDADAATIQDAWLHAHGDEEAFVQNICRNTTLWNGVDLSEIEGFERMIIDSLLQPKRNSEC